MKYYVARKSKFTGRVEYQMYKCLDKKWCSAEYIRYFPEEVWQFSQQGAKKIADRYNGYREHGALGNWNFEYFIVPVSDILENLQGGI